MAVSYYREIIAGFNVAAGLTPGAHWNFVVNGLWHFSQNLSFVLNLRTGISPVPIAGAF